MNDKIKISTEFDHQQKDLIAQLRNYGDNLSQFYEDILKLINNENLQTKTNLCAHLARDLNVGVNYALSNTNKDNYCDCKCDDKYRIDEFNPKNCKICNKQILSNKEKISLMLGLQIDDEKVCLWHNVTSSFPGLAHIDTKTRTIKEFNKFLENWKKYEKLLQEKFGEIGKTINNLDDIIKNPSPSSATLTTLKTMLKIESLNYYFFSSLKQFNWLKPLNEAGFFNPENNPKPKPAEDGNGYYILSWSIFNYLEWISKSLPTNDESVVKELIKIINRIIDYKRENGKRIQNFRTDFSIFKILNNIPSDYITENHLSFIKNSLEIDFHSGLIGSELSKGFITKLTTDDKKELLLKLVDVVCSYKTINNDIEPLIEEYWFAGLIKKHKERLAEYSGKEIIEIIITRIKEIKKEDSGSFNVVWIPTIESHEQKSFPERYEAQLIDLFVECLIHLENDTLVEKIRMLLEDDFDIFRRVGIYLVNQKFEILNKLLFNLKYNPLEDYNLKHEIYELLKSNATKFSEDQIKVIIKWIEGKNYYLDNIKPEEKDGILAYRKKEWYYPILPSENKEIQNLYKKYNEINDKESEHPGFVSWHTTWCGEVTPLQEFELERASIDKIIYEINTFKEEEGFRKPSIRGFADTIQKDVENNPAKYYSAIDKFKEVDFAYLCSIIRGFINICRKNNDKKEEGIIELDWEKILNFVNEKINESFWDIKSSGEFNYRDWFVSEIANLIEDGTKYDRVAFDVKLLPMAKEILLKLTKHNIFYPINNDDYVTFALNSTEGKILDAMLNYSLRNYRVVKKEWNEDIKNYFTEKITEKKHIEVFTIVGQYLPQFYTLNKGWVESNFDLIFPLNDLNIFKASISGLFFNPTVYSNFYSLFKEKGIYKFLLDSWEQNNNGLNESLLRHICLGYAEKWEEIEDDSLIKELLSKHDALDEVVRFFWIIAKNIKQDYPVRMKELWKYIFDNNKDSSITGKLMQWLNIFNKLDDDLFSLCIGGARFVNAYDAHYIIEYLVKYIDSDVEKVGKILLELVHNIDIISDYRKEYTIKIIEKLYSENKKQLANEICNKYFEKQGLLFLREIYNSNNTEVKNE